MTSHSHNHLILYLHLLINFIPPNLVILIQLSAREVDFTQIPTNKIKMDVAENYYYHAWLTT